jgi:hypothetical protein
MCVYRERARAREGRGERDRERERDLRQVPDINALILFRRAAAGFGGI